MQPPSHRQIKALILLDDKKKKRFKLTACSIKLKRPGMIVLKEQICRTKNKNVYNYKNNYKLVSVSDIALIILICSP